MTNMTLMRSTHQLDARRGQTCHWLDRFTSSEPNGKAHDIDAWRWKGKGPNGDPVAVELATGEVAFLSHDLLWGLDPESTEFEECVARSTLDLDTFWSRALAEDDFPIDFYAASGSR